MSVSAKSQLFPQPVGCADLAFRSRGSHKGVEFISSWYFRRGRQLAFDKVSALVLQPKQVIHPKEP